MNNINVASLIFITIFVGGLVAAYIIMRKQSKNKKQRKNNTSATNTSATNTSASVSTNADESVIHTIPCIAGDCFYAIDD